MAVAPPLARGERAPDFALPTQDGVATRFYARAGGRPAVLLFYDADAHPDALASLLTLERNGEVALYAVNGSPVERNRAASEQLSLEFPLWSDLAGEVAGAYRLNSPDPLLLVLDANVRVLGTTTSAAQVPGLLSGAPLPGPPEVVRAQAPVLLIPDALEATTCADLMEVWEREGNVDTGVEQTQGGRRTEVLSAVAKRRRDHTVTDPRLLARISSEVGRRVMPEVRRAFAYRATRFEGFKIGCYEADPGGFFRAHRDNLSPSTAHRRFALTLNLNDAYDGGELRFPEYGPQRYRPDAGAALIFSCSLLHEVLEVVDGRRFVLLSFLFSDEPAHRGPSGRPSPDEPAHRGPSGRPSPDEAPRGG